MSLCLSLCLCLCLISVPVSNFGFGFGFISAYITCLYSFYFRLAFVSVFPTGHCRLLFLLLVLPRFRNVLFSSAFGFAFAFDFDFGLGFRFAFGFGLGLGWVGLGCLS